MPLPRASELVARFDFARESPAALAAARDTLVTALAQAGLTPHILPSVARPHRPDAAAAAWLLGALLVAVGARRRRFRRTGWVAGTVAVLLGVGAFGGGLDAFLPARAAATLEVVVEPESTVAREIVLGAHYDSKTELFDHVGRAVAYTAALLLLVAGFAVRRSAAGFVAACALAAAAAAGGRFAGARSHGIVDDAAAVALVVEIAAQVRAAPLATTRLRAVWWCDEEVGAQGSAAWLRDAHLDSVPRRGINLECIGAGPRLGYAAREWTGAGWRRAPGAVVAALQNAAFDSLHALALPVVTDAGPLRRRGIEIVTLVGLEADASPPRGLHRSSDAMEALDAHGLARAATVVRRFLAAADGVP